MLDVVTLGETMVLFVPTRTGLLRYAQQFDRYVAGAESNTAIGLARIGHQVGWISKVGQDEFGEYILAFLRGEQVDVSQAKRSDTMPTGVFFKERRRMDSTRVFYYRTGSAASHLSPNDLNQAYISQSKFLHLTGITPALSSDCREATHEAIKIAHKADIQISFDPNIRFKLWPAQVAKEALLHIIPKINILLTSMEEAFFLTGESNKELAARSLLSLGPKQVIIKLGERGAYALTDSEEILEPGIKVQVVETVGAGDAFNAGFLSGQLRGWSLQKSLHLGNIMGALATTAPGDVEGLPDWGEIQPYLGGNQVVER